MNYFRKKCYKCWALTKAQFILHELIPDFKLSDMIDNSSLNIVEYSNGQYHLKALNQTSHFALRKEAVEREFSLLPMTLFEK